MNKPKPLPMRIARMTGEPIEVVEAGLAGELELSSPCWMWQGTTTTGWLPLMNIDGRPQSVRRVLFELFDGPVQKPHQVRHACMMPLCVNPAHAYIEWRLDVGRGRPGTRPLSERTRTAMQKVSGEPKPWDVEQLAKRLKLARWHVEEAIAELEAEPGLECAEYPDDDPIEDVVGTVYDQTEPWDAQDISERTGYSLAKVEEAIRLIQAGEM